MKIAITGTIGSGKSTVCDYIRAKGYDVFSCDDYNRELLEKDNEGYLIIKRFFPDCIINEKLDKRLVASIIFKNDDKRKLLEGKLHPLILNKMLETSKKYDVFFAEVPLLFETGFDKYFDKSWLVVGEESDIVERLICRGMQKDDAISRIKTQMPVETKKNMADEIIYNNKDLNNLFEKTDELLIKYVG